jgi:nucleotide-binding universal stress UspA family protein
VKNHTPDEIQPELVVHQGMAPDSILAFAEAQKADLIVMGDTADEGLTA